MASFGQNTKILHNLPRESGAISSMDVEVMTNIVIPDNPKRKITGDFLAHTCFSWEQ